jgi:hypothetical protein
LAPPTGSQPLPRWVWGPVLVPCRPGTPTYKLQVKTRSGACTHLPPDVLQHRILPPSQGGLQGYYMSSGTSSRLPDREGSDTTTCAVALDPLGGLRCAVCHTAPDPTSLHGGLWAAMRHVVLCGPRASCMKKSLAGLLMWRGLPVPNARAHISKVPDVVRI